MNRILSSLGLMLYILAAAAALVWWAPHFFSVNLHSWPQLNYRYIAASGIPFGLMLISVASRQSLMPQFSVYMLLQVGAAWLFLTLGIMAFNYLPQSVFFCAAHLFVCAVFTVWNFYCYRRDKIALQRRRAAMLA